MKVIAVIPAYNERKTIAEVVKRTRKFVDKVVVIDDGSKDNTGELARKEGAKVLVNKQNMGVGYSKRRGIKTAIEFGADIIVTLDADLQHSPEDIPRFVKKVKEGYDFVLGSRNLEKYPWIKKFGNFCLNNLTNFICGTKLKDTESGYKAFSAEAAKKMNLKAKGYHIESEIVYEVGKNKLRYTTIDIQSPVYRKGVTVLGGIKNFIYLLKKKKSDL